MKLVWEMLDQDDYSTTLRARVAGGWLYRVCHCQGMNEIAIAESLCFVPDAEVPAEIPLSVEERSDLGRAAELANVAAPRDLAGAVEMVRRAQPDGDAA